MIVNTGTEENKLKVFHKGKIHELDVNELKLKETTNITYIRNPNKEPIILI